MSSNKTQKWSSSATLTKLVSRITRTLSFSSKKHPQLSKKNNQIVQQLEPTIKNIPQSVPVRRRYSPQPNSKKLYSDDILQSKHYRQDIHVNMYDMSENEEVEEDYSRYSLRPNLSLFNISMENLHSQQAVQHHDWLDNILHSTKIEHY